MATIGIDVSSDRIVLVINVIGSGIETDLDPSKQTIANVITKIDVLREGIVGCACLDNIPHVIVVGGDGLGIGVVRVDFFDSSAKSCVPEELADMSDVVCGGDGVVGEDRDVHMGQEMGMGCTT
jgi:hypothetical protein